MSERYKLVLKDTDYDSVKLAMTTTDENTLEKLSKDSDSSVRYEVAMNKNCPEKILIKLAEDTNKDVVRAVAQNKNTPVDVLEKLLKQELQNTSNYWLTYDILENPNFKKSELSKDIKYMNTVEAQDLAESTTDPKVLRELSEHIRSKEINPCLAYNKNTPQDILTKLAESHYRLIRKLVAENPSTPVNVLEKLSKDIDTNVKAGVASNPSATKDILEKLANDKANSVKNTAKNNLSTKYKLVLKDEDIDLDNMSTSKKEDLAVNTKDENILRKLSKDDSGWVRRYVALNKNTPVDILRELAEDKGLRNLLANNPNTPVDILEKLAGDGDKWTRKELASNPNTPEDVLKQLANDENEDVSKKALLNLKGRNMKITSKSFSIIKVSPDTDYKEADVRIKFKINNKIESMNLQFFIEEKVLHRIEDLAEQYCKETGRDFEEVVEQLDYYYVDFSTLEEEAETKFEDAISDLNLPIGDREYKIIISKIVNSAKKCIKENFSYDEELVDDFNNWCENHRR